MYHPSANHFHLLADLLLHFITNKDNRIKWLEKLWMHVQQMRGHRGDYNFLGELINITMALANALVPVTTDMNIKVLIKLKLQLRNHTDHTLIFTVIDLVYLMI